MLRKRGCLLRDSALTVTVLDYRFRCVSGACNSRLFLNIIKDVLNIDIEDDKYIGEEYGIYVIKDVLPNKDKWNHKIYKGVCKQCGYERFGTINDFKGKMISNCTHIRLLSDEQFNIWFNKNKRRCLFCGKVIDFDKKSCVSEYNIRLFCNHRCAASYNNFNRKRPMAKKYYCINCGKETNKGCKYCSTKCQSEYNYKVYINKWKNNEVNGLSGKYSISKHIRKYFFEKYNNKCSRCGWGETNPFTNKIPLEVHHKDGNYKNNIEDNLELLCPNCHSLTHTYKSANIGNGRQDRKKYYIK